MSVAWSRLDYWKALAYNLVTGGARIRVRRYRRVFQAKSRITALTSARVNAVPSLANANFLCNLTSFVATYSILLTNPLQKATDHQKSRPLPLAVVFQLHDFFHSAIVSTRRLGVVIVVSGQHFSDFYLVLARLLLKTSHSIVECFRLNVQSVVRCTT